MITIETQVTGSQIGFKLSQKPEQFAYALIEMSDEMSVEDRQAAGGYISAARAPAVIQMLEQIIAAIKEATQ